MAIVKRAPGWWYPWIFVGGMIIVAVVNGVMIYFATSTFTGLETKGHFEKGVAYNKNLEAARLQREIGWSASADLAPGEPGQDGYSGTLRVDLRDGAGKPIPDLDVRVLITRPTQEGFDQQVDLAGAGSGAYRAVLRLPLKGIWDVRVIANGGPQPYQQVIRLFAQ